MKRSVCAFVLFVFFITILVSAPLPVNAATVTWEDDGVPMTLITSHSQWQNFYITDFRPAIEMAHTSGQITELPLYAGSKTVTGTISYCSEPSRLIQALRADNLDNTYTYVWGDQTVVVPASEEDSIVYVRIKYRYSSGTWRIYDDLLVNRSTNSTLTIVDSGTYLAPEKSIYISYGGRSA